MTYGHLQADCLYTGISSGPNARYRVWEAFTFYLLPERKLVNCLWLVSDTSPLFTRSTPTSSVVDVASWPSWSSSGRRPSSAVYRLSSITLCSVRRVSQPSTFACVCSCSREPGTQSGRLCSSWQSSRCSSSCRWSSRFASTPSSAANCSSDQKTSTIANRSVITSSDRGGV